MTEITDTHVRKHQLQPTPERVNQRRDGPGCVERGVFGPTQHRRGVTTGGLCKLHTFGFSDGSNVCLSWDKVLGCSPSNTHTLQCARSLAFVSLSSSASFVLLNAHQM